MAKYSESTIAEVPKRLQAGAALVTGNRGSTGDPGDRNLNQVWPTDHGHRGIHSGKVNTFGPEARIVGILFLQ